MNSNLTWDDFKPCYVLINPINGNIVTGARPYTSIKMAIKNNKYVLSEGVYTLAKYTVREVIDVKNSNY